jgi:hypothetical protein
MQIAEKPLRADARRNREKVLAATGAEGNFVVPTGTRLRVELPRLVWHQDEPFGSTSSAHTSRPRPRRATGTNISAPRRNTVDVELSPAYSGTPAARYGVERTPRCDPGGFLEPTMSNLFSYRRYLKKFSQEINSYFRIRKRKCKRMWHFSTRKNKNAFSVRAGLLIS